MPTRLPPADKLPLALRKNIRDTWETKLPDLEKQLSGVLGVSWTVDIDPKAVYPYAVEGYAKESLGSCLVEYVDSAIYQLKSFKDNYGADGLEELNKVCSAHILTMDLDEEQKFSYCGCDVKDGKLRILFGETRLAVNISDAVQKEYLHKALNEAPAPEGSEETFSYEARSSIKNDYESKIGDVQKKIGTILSRPEIKLVPNFEDTYAKLTAESKKSGTSLRSDWQTNIGSWTFSYFDGLATQLDWQKFGSDELLQEGFNEAVEKQEIAFRIVDKFKYASYCEVVVEDGVLYIQTTAERWGVNITDAAEKLVDQL